MLNRRMYVMVLHVLAALIGVLTVLTNWERCCKGSKRRLITAQLTLLLAVSYYCE